MELLRLRDLHCFDYISTHMLVLVDDLLKHTTCAWSSLPHYYGQNLKICTSVCESYGCNIHQLHVSGDAVNRISLFPFPAMWLNVKSSKSHGTPKYKLHSTYLKLLSQLQLD